MEFLMTKLENLRKLKFLQCFLNKDRKDQLLIFLNGWYYIIKQNKKILNLIIIVI